MRDPNRIPRILAEIQRIWKRYPDLRLGQLLENGKYNIDDADRMKASVTPTFQQDLFYLEDEELVANLKQFDGRMEDQKRSV